MDKSAKVKFDIQPDIVKRWSPRSFTDESIDLNDFRSLFEAASWAPSSMNEQPWRFVGALKEDKEQFEALRSLLVPGNEKWAKNAAALVVVLSKSHYNYKDRPNVNYQHDAGLATMNLLIQATYKGLHAHVMEGFDKEQAARQLALDKNIEPLTMIAIGHRGEPDQLEEPLLEREKKERSRRPLTDTLFRPSDSIK